MKIRTVAVPSRSGRNSEAGWSRRRTGSPSPQGRVGTRSASDQFWAELGRRPLKVGSEPSIVTNTSPSMSRRRPLRSGRDPKAATVWGHFPIKSPSPQGRVGTKTDNQSRGSNWFAVPSRSGRDKTSTGVPSQEKRGRRPLKVGSGHRYCLAASTGTFVSPSPQGRVGTPSL